MAVQVWSKRDGRCADTLILLRQAIERGGLTLTATGNLSRAVVTDMCKLIEWPGYDPADAFRFNKIINEPDFLPLHVIRILTQAATLVRPRRGKLVATPLGKSMLSAARQGSLSAILFHIAFWRMDLGYFGRGLLGSWPQADIGIVRSNQKIGVYRGRFRRSPRSRPATRRPCKAEWAAKR